MTTIDLSVSTNEEKEVAIATAKFYAALNQTFTGDMQAMEAVWSHADDVTYMGPMGGFQVGWNQVLEVWKAHTDMKIGGRVTPVDMRITLGADVAISHNYEVGENTTIKSGAQQVSIRATNIFRKEGSEWKMVGHPTDLLPFLA